MTTTQEPDYEEMGNIYCDAFIRGLVSGTIAALVLWPVKNADAQVWFDTVLESESSVQEIIDEVDAQIHNTRMMLEYPPDPEHPSDVKRRVQYGSWSIKSRGTAFGAHCFFEHFLTEPEKSLYALARYELVLTSLTEYAERGDDVEAQKIDAFRERINQVGNLNPQWVRIQVMAKLSREYGAPANALFIGANSNEQCAFLSEVERALDGFSQSAHGQSNPPAPPRQPHTALHLLLPTMPGIISSSEPVR